MRRLENFFCRLIATLLVFSLAVEPALPSELIAGSVDHRGVLNHPSVFTEEALADSPVAALWNKIRQWKLNARILHQGGVASLVRGEWKAMIVPVKTADGGLEVKDKEPSVRIELTRADIGLFDSRRYDGNPFENESAEKAALWRQFHQAMRMSGTTLEYAMENNHLDRIVLERGTNNLVGETVFGDRIATVRIHQKLTGLGEILTFIEEAIWLKRGRAALQVEVTAEAVNTFLLHLPLLIDYGNSVLNAFREAIKGLDLHVSGGIGQFAADILYHVPSSTYVGQMFGYTFIDSARSLDFYQFESKRLLSALERILNEVNRRHPDLLQNSDGTPRRAMPVPAAPGVADLVEAIQTGNNARADAVLQVLTPAKLTEEGARQIEPSERKQDNYLALVNKQTRMVSYAGRIGWGIEVNLMIGSHEQLIPKVDDYDFYKLPIPISVLYVDASFVGDAASLIELRKILPSNRTVQVIFVGPTQETERVSVRSKIFQPKFFRWLGNFHPDGALFVSGSGQPLLSDAKRKDPDAQGITVLRSGDWETKVKPVIFRGLATGESTKAWFAEKWPRAPLWLTPLLAATVGILHRNELGMFVNVFDSDRIRREHPDHPKLAMAAFWVMRATAVAGLVAPLLHYPDSLSHLVLAMAAGAVLSYLKTHLAINMAFIAATSAAHLIQQSA